MTPFSNFRIDALLQRINGKGCGLPGVGRFAQEMTGTKVTQYNPPGQLHFDHPAMLQRSTEKPFTPFNHLFIAYQTPTDVYISLWVDTTGVLIEAACTSGKKITIYDYFPKQKFANKASDGHIRAVCTLIFRHQECLDIQQLGKLALSPEGADDHLSTLGHE